MRTAAHAFYLAFFSLLSAVQTGSAAEHGADNKCAIDPKSHVSDACTTYSALDTLNADLAPAIKDVTQNTDFFSYYRLNLYNKVCPFWSDETSLCGNRACAVDTLENEEDIPEIWRAEELSKLEGPRAGHPTREKQVAQPQKPLGGGLGEDVGESCVVEYDDECDERDYCIPDDEGAAAKGDYVSLVNNTERFTGYAGPGARQVWDSIYKENCFTQASSESSSFPDTIFPVAKGAAQDLRHVFQEYGRQHVEEADEDAYPLNDECLEQRAFYRIISGMHASISTHLCQEYFNQTTGEWGRNIQCYKDRLHKHPERVSNLYFNYAVLTRAIVKLRTYLKTYTFCSGDPIQDRETKTKVLSLLNKAAKAPNTFDENLMFHGNDGLLLKEDFRNRFRNVSRIMDCVGCDKCRLWGKIQVNGYGAALKVLFEFDENKNGENPPLRRTELVALLNTWSRVSHSLTSIQGFRADLASGSSTANHIPGQKHSQPNIPAPPPSSAIDNNGGNDDDVFADFNFDNDPEPPRKRPSITEEFWSELDLVWRAWTYVLKSWITFPLKAPAIIIMELNRLWAFWLGLPVPPRSWGIHLPRRDEL